MSKKQKTILEAIQENAPTPPKKSNWKRVEYWTISLATEAFLTAFAIKGIRDSLGADKTLGVVISYTLIGVMLYLQLRVKLDK